MKEQARVSRLSVGRLCNLGNYEHIRYEVTVEIPEGADATRALKTVETALNTLAEPPPGNPRQEEEDLASHEVENLPAYQRLVDAYAAWQKRQEYARAVLGDFSLSSELTDHKDHWDDDQ